MKQQGKKQKDKVQTVENVPIITPASIVSIEEIEGNISTFTSQKQITNNLILAYVKDLLLNEIVQENQIISYTLCGRKNNLRIASILPKLEEGKWIVIKDTIFQVQERQITIQNEKQNLSTQQKLYGVEIYIQKIKRLIDDTFNQEMEKLQNLGFEPIKGILIVGQSGVGKTTILKLLKEQLSSCYSFKLIQTSSDENQSINELLSREKKSTPNIIILDDIQTTKNESLIKQIQSLFNSIQSNEKTIIIGATTSLKNIDESLRRSGRFEKEVIVELPTQTERCQIFTQLLKDLGWNFEDEELRTLALQMSGFTINDIKSVFRDAYLKGEGIKSLPKVLRSSNSLGVKDILAETPCVKWSDIGGYKYVKEEVIQAIEWPLRYAESFSRLGVRPSKGVLLYGPPGCCKTLLARAIANECNLNFMAVKGPELFSKYVGDSEKAIREIFKKARLCAPSVVFFDEIDAIAPQRSGSTDVSDRVLIQLLTEIDGFQELKNVIVVGATNRPSSIDKALIRPGRFDHLIYVGVPDESSRKEIFQVNFRKMPINQNVQLDQLVSRTNGYTGAEICQICKEAGNIDKLKKKLGLLALSKNIDSVSIEMEDLEKSILKIKPRVSSLMLETFKSFQENAKLNM